MQKVKPNQQTNKPQGQDHKEEEAKLMPQEEKKKYLQSLAPKIPASTENAILELPDGTKIEIPIIKPQKGPPALDIRKLYAQTGHFTFDPGFTSTGSCASNITYLDGKQGELQYRGYKLQDLAENASYMEVCYLLIYGQLPDQKELTRFEDLVVSEMRLHQKIIEFYQGFQKDAHPMAILIGVLGGSSSYVDEKTRFQNIRHREAITIHSIAKVASMAAYAYRVSNGLPIVQPKKSYGYMKNFLYMMFSNPMDDDFEIDQSVIRALEIIFIVHADHEQNASTSTVRISGSSLANPYAVLSSGISSLWGPAHGGANEAVMNMLKDIGTVDKIPEYLEKVKRKETRLQGFGHRVYKNFDPRAQIMKNLCKKVLKELKQDENLLELALKLEEVALQDQYFTSRKLYPNMDYYTGLIYQALDIPKTMYTPMFTVSRVSGWVQQWNEFMSEPTFKIGRPRQLYVGENQREFVKLNQRPLQETRIQEIPQLNKITQLFEL